MDRMAGGVGWRRGRRHATDLVVGDFLDFWRVLEVKPARRLLLMAELKAPGEMVLDVRLKETAGPVTEVDMIVRFRPLGLWGLWYWYALLPFHVWLFKGLLGAVAKRLGRPVVEGPIRFKPELGPAAGSSS
jgi:hypothetical protein